MKKILHEIINNIINDKDLLASYENLTDLLSEKELNKEACYSLECCIRLCNDIKKQLDFNTKIINLNIKNCKTSYDMYCIFNSPIVYQFPINPDTEKDKHLLYDVDKYISILHGLMLFKTEADFKYLLKINPEIQALKKIVSSEIKKSKNTKLKNVTNKIIALLEKNFTDFLLEMTTNPKVLVSCLNFYPNEEEYYKKVLAKIIDINGFSEGLIFHNKIYAVKYRKHKASCMYDMFYEIIDFERENKQYFKALTAEIKAAVLTLKEGGKSV